jgi:hypothetical protein
MDLAAVAALIADPSRAAMLDALTGGEGFTAGEPARVARIAVDRHRAPGAAGGRRPGDERAALRAASSVAGCGAAATGARSRCPRRGRPGWRPRSA